MGRAVGFQIVSPRTTIVLLEMDKMLTGACALSAMQKVLPKFIWGSSPWCN